MPKRNKSPYCTVMPILSLLKRVEVVTTDQLPVPNPKCLPLIRNSSH